MYNHQGLQEISYLMLYGGAAMLAIVACLYLLFSKGNMFNPQNKPVKELRMWTAAFFASVALSHIWWVVLGINILADDRLVRNIIAVSLDRMTFIPLMMCVLVRMLQDKRRALWPVAVSVVPMLIICVWGIVAHSEHCILYSTYYCLGLCAMFVLLYVDKVRKYGKWLHENYADLEHKEVWQSLVFLSITLIVYIIYNSNDGSLLIEYSTQVNTLIIIVFLVWRVETLQPLETEAPVVQQTEIEVPEDQGEQAEQVEESANTNVYVKIGALLKQKCESSQLYLEHDLSLQQLAASIGTNRTYLSNYFAQQGTNYNTYINKLRIEHFVRLYRQALATSSNITASELAFQSGYHSYSTFGVAFKKHTGYSVKEWMDREK